MKKFSQKIVQMAMVIAVLCPSIGSAEDGFVSGMTTTGWTAFVVGSGLYAIKGDPPDCFIYPTNFPAPNTGPTGNCDAHNDHQKERSNYAAAGALGGIVALVGEGIQLYNGNQETPIPFQVRPVLNGFAIERDGLSFSAAANGRVRLQKRWEF